MRRLFYGPASAHVLLVGQAPSRTSKPREALLRTDLATLCSLSLEDYGKAFARTNVLTRYPGRAAKGDLFPVEEAREGARALTQVLDRFRLVVLLGRGVEKAFGLPAESWFEIKSDLGTRVVTVPHPSKVNTWWNDKKNVRAAKRFWTKIAREIACRA